MIQSIYIFIKMIDEQTGPSSTFLYVSGGTFILATLGGICIKILVQNNNNKSNIRKKLEVLDRKKKVIIDKTRQIENIDLNIGLDELLSNIQSEKYKIIDVLHAFQRKAVIANNDLNFLIDINDYAEIDAVECQKSKHKSLRGVPVSIKDYFQVKHCNSTYGSTRLANQPCYEDSVLVRVLRDSGAIPFAVTNMAQTGYSIESSNPLIGATRNPFNPNRTCGGSSGGEGAIIGCGASIIGLGSDVGGSIRIPSHYCGIYGFKPTSRRCSHGKIRELWPGQDFIRVSSGPMARRFPDLVSVFKVLSCSDMYQLDPSNPPLCFNETMYEKTGPLKIGCYTMLGKGYVRPIPAVERAVNMAKQALRDAGHKIVDIEIPNLDHGIDLFTKSLFSDGGYGIYTEGIGSDFVDPTLSVLTTILKMPVWLRKIVSYLMYPVNRSYSQILYGMCGVDNITDLWRLFSSITEYRDHFLQYMQAHKIDGIVCPVLPIVAPLHGTTTQFMDVTCYTAIYNILDWPAGVVPVTKVTKEDIKKMRETYPRDTPSHRAIFKNQSMDDTEGLPVGVQCVSMMWRDETCLRIMRDLSNQLNAT